MITNSNSKDDPNGGRFDNRVECFKVINVWGLMKPFGNKFDPISFNTPIKIVLDFEYPFIASNMYIGRPKDENLHIIVNKGNILRLYS